MSRKRKKFKFNKKQIQQMSNSSREDEIRPPDSFPTDVVKDVEEVIVEGNDLQIEGPFERKGTASFSLVLKKHSGEYAVVKRYEDGKEEILMSHHLSGCIKAFEIRREVYRGLYTSQEITS